MAVEQTFITSDAELERIYGAVAKPSLTKETDHIHPAYRPFIEASPFVALATSGPGGLDVSPRGDPAGFVVIEDAKTLLLPDRRGNNRIDSLRNILHDNRVALLFLIPGIGETLRVNGTAKITTDPELLHRFAVNHQLPKTVLRIAVESVFFSVAAPSFAQSSGIPPYKSSVTSSPAQALFFISFPGLKLMAMPMIRRCRND